MQNTTTDWPRALLIPLTILSWLAVSIVTLWLLGHVAITLIILAFSGIIAFALGPLVSLLSRWLPRGIATALAYVLGFAVIAGLGAVIATSASNEITTLVHNLPSYQHRLQTLEPRIVRLLGPFGVTRATLHRSEHEAIAYLQGIGTSVAKDSVSIASQTLSTLVQLVLTLILSIYLTNNGPRMAAWLRRETPNPYRRPVMQLLTIVNQVVGGYVRGTLTMAALVGVLVGGGMFVLGVPFASVLGILAFFMEFVPVVGVLISGAVCVLVALTKGWQLAAIVLAYFVIVHLIEAYLVGPRVMGRAVGIHPMTAIIALVAGNELFGIWGALFGAPIAGLLQALGTTIWRELRQADPGAHQQNEGQGTRGETTGDEDGDVIHEKRPA